MKKAVLQVCGYLQCSKGKRLISKPTESLGLESCADADFTDLYGVQNNHDPIRVTLHFFFVEVFRPCQHVD